MKDGFLENWSSQLRKGILELYVLNALLNEKLYGYDIVRRLRELPGLVITEGTIYPVLSRLKREGLVETTLEESPEGPARKYYRLSRSGHRAIDQMNGQWGRIVEGIEQINRKERE